MDQRCTTGRLRDDGVLPQLDLADGAGVHGVLQAVDAERDEAAAQPQAKEGHRAAGGPDGKPGLLGGDRGDGGPAVGALHSHRERLHAATGDVRRRGPAQARLLLHHHGSAGGLEHGRGLLLLRLLLRLWLLLLRLPRRLWLPRL